MDELLISIKVILILSFAAAVLTVFFSFSARKKRKQEEKQNAQYEKQRAARRQRERLYQKLLQDERLDEEQRQLAEQQKLEEKRRQLEEEQRKLKAQQKLKEELKLNEQRHQAEREDLSIPCHNCSGHYVLRSGSYSLFVGCSNYPKCKSTQSLPEVILEYIKLYGIGIYRWEKTCWKCQKQTPVYSYYLTYEIDKALPGESMMCFQEAGLGDIETIDNILLHKYPSLKNSYSKTTNSKYIANTCVHCSAIQGHNYVVDDPHEIMDKLWHSGNMSKYFIEKISIPDINSIRKDIERIYVQ